MTALRAALAALAILMLGTINVSARPHYDDWSRYSNHHYGHQHHYARHTKRSYKKHRHAKASKAKRSIYRRAPKKKFYAPREVYSEMAKLTKDAAAKSEIVAKAMVYLGKTARQIGLSRATLWCSTFIREKVAPGFAGIDDRAASWLRRPRIAAMIGAVAVTTRRGGNHVGIVLAIRPGRVLLLSGNYRGRVATGWYSVGRVIGYVSADPVSG